MRRVALVVAAGSGIRAGGEIPKQYRRVGGRPVLRWALELFCRHPMIDAVATVIAAEHAPLYAEASRGLPLLPPIAGGPTRQASVRAGLEALAADAPDLVLIHDAARPFLSSALVSRVAAALEQHPAVLPALPVVDSLRRTRGERVLEDVDRADLVRIQTPQGFAFGAILDAHRRAPPAGFTDDGAVAAWAGLPVIQVPGEEDNVKLTLPEDFEAAERRLIAAAVRRTGQGIDVHRLVPGRRLVLGGVEIPFELGLEGHSDADVVLHALTDAILGTIGAGDIGSHFPPSDPRWRDAESSRFVRHALSLLAAAGGVLEHVDLTLLAERPRIAPHRAAMRARLAQLLELGEEAVSLKATTTEGLGFIGRGEGIAAWALATARFARSP
ncbi:MAG: bifunctional 2-C-methyl-D-erythritol 4-phosphate cytidylyltransferase/2-C-methyl-D-erythritol 2,4-cyclodiphosphate synthase [Geminicoccaceae bacterium]|nr:bifunctional 2-C-methyl-D-erythritol 4-phosphate cytidylyltransferase/2-C-methyl-D-erythritol 2,4-cyclodiphosphate synthase [Geminicoccaceae bacterium]MDW8371121.1 bifunctional 2-C-methyl-D-erythritol 4-phosphate cytidylyltransferase/2-C-methyl-D-erythritol 2,4-cyclodiphosphate synthase [Geminicoccaceae bacterium]